MKKRPNIKESAGWVDLPNGIFTADGIWFHTTESALREFAGEVMEREGVGSLVMASGSWLRSADTACAIALPGLLVATSPGIAATAALALYVAWDFMAPKFVFLSVVRLFSALSSAAVQGILYVVVLSWLGMNDAILAVGVGLVGFILLRWGLIRKALAWGSKRFATRDVQLPRQDRILRSLLLRHAVSMHITLPSTEAFEERILEIWNRGKRK